MLGNLLLVVVGKTRLIAVMAAYLVSLGFHVALGAATHDATGNLIETVVPILANSKDPAMKQIRPVRVYRSLHEDKELFKNKGDNVNDGDDDSIGQEDLTDAEADADALLLPIFQELKMDQSSKAFSHPELSLQARCVQSAFDAEANGSVLMGSYVESSQKPSQNSQPKPPLPIGMFAEFRRFYQKLSLDEPFRKWDEEEQKHFRQAYNRVRDSVMQGTHLIASTTNSLGAPYIRQYFGHNAKGIIVFLEGASMEREDNSWMFLKFANLEKVKGVVVVGDIFQLKPLIISAHQQVKLNEFAQQLLRSLMARMFRQGFLLRKLRTQHRMHPDISTKLNEMISGGALRDDTTTRSRLLSKDLQRVFRQWLGVRPSANVNTIALDIHYGGHIVDLATASRPNVYPGLSLWEYHGQEKPELVCS